jgi:ElaB/YqjD/DUF883 family membrane-anchored ribosome-binding protein
MASMETNPQQFQDKARDLQARVVPQIEEAAQNLTELNTRVVGFIRANPGTCLIGAVAVGFLIGKLASR